MSKYTLGLDIGSNSIGWALLNTGKKPSIVDTGVRVFPEGVDRDTKGAELSKNATRRVARGTRRMRSRRTYRKDKLVRTFKRAGMLPKDPKALNKLLATDPYPLRAKGLDERLTLHEFGRVLFHINQRRGFKSNRKKGKAKEDGVVKQAASALQDAIDNAGCRTLGEYFAKIDPHEERIRAHYTFRSMYEHEFDLLWQKQSEYYPDVLTEQLREKTKDKTIFYQRPLKPTDELIGECSLEEGEKRCPRGDWYARRFRILQDVNNLKIYNPDGSEQGLSDVQRQIVLKEMLSKKDVSFDSLRKKLGLIETQTFNLEEGRADKKKANLKGDEFAAQMRSKKILGAKKWKAIDIRDQIEINEALIADEIDDVTFVKMLIEQHAFTEEQAATTLDVTLPQRYMSFSKMAIQRLLPYMEGRLLTHEAIEKAYGKDKGQATQVSLEKLDKPPDVRNPIVQKAISETRKVVNALIREYGKPDKIAIEMARDVKGSMRERQEIAAKMRKNEKINDDARSRLIEDLNIHNPTFDDILKYKLWTECNKQCPYTGKNISQNALFGPNPEFQVEHILPYSRSLDDSYMNKTLCCVNENRLKEKQTPYEFYSGQPEKYEQVKQRVAKLPWPKRRRFLQKEIDIDEMIRRQLNDTRYITREVVDYLKRLGVYVHGTKGQTTASLRRCWGLNNILDYAGPGLKNRDDHRHHAVDAVVVGLTTNKHLRTLAKSKYSTTDHAFPPPWSNFREQVQEKINKINVSHHVTRKVSGQLHEETAYGLTGLKDEKGQEIFVHRKRLEDLTVPMVEKIVDPVVREIVKRRLKQYGIDPDKNQKISKEVWNEPVYMKSKKGKRTPIRKVRIRDVFNNMIMLKDRFGKPYRAVAPGNNHHIEIFEYTDKKGNIKRDGRVVTMFEAVRRSQNKELVAQRDHGPGKKFICSLAKNEMLMFELDDGSEVLHRLQKITQSGSSISIILRPHTYAGKVSDSDSPPIIQRRSPNTLKGYKVMVEPLGRICPAND
jgi:CRISPR-associated endonuclease Csn1